MVLLSKKEKVINKRLALRAKLWPQLKENDVWDRKKKKGFTTIPRTLPIFMIIMDSLSKGRPVSGVYFELWCRAFDEHFVTLNNKEDMSFHAGFQGQRGIQTWTSRLDILAEMGFIKLATGSNGPRSYALILNPYEAIKKYQKGKKSRISESLYNALVGRASDVGADDDI
jgi:hypothetical protein